MVGSGLELGVQVRGLAGAPVNLSVLEKSIFFPGVDESTGFVTRSLVAVPLKVRDSVAGVIEVVNKLEGGFTDQVSEFTAQLPSAIASDQSSED